MGNFNNPVGGPIDPFDKKLRVEPIEEDKLAKNKREKEPDSEITEEKLAVASSLLQMFRKTVDSFLEASESAEPSAKNATENLLLLKKAFETLKKEDRSEDAPFLNELSKIWHHVLEDALHFQGTTALAEHFKTLVRKIQNFPQNQTHTLGYYLAEYAGQKWIPFPYMELIANIHSEHEKSPPYSALNQWTQLIDEIIVLLKSDTI